MLVDSHFDFLFVPEPVVLVALALAAVVQLLHDIHSCNRLVLHKHHPEVLRAPIFPALAAETCSFWIWFSASCAEGFVAHFGQLLIDLIQFIIFFID